MTSEPIPATTSSDQPPVTFNDLATPFEGGTSVNAPIDEPDARPRPMEGTVSQMFSGASNVTIDGNNVFTTAQNIYHIHSPMDALPVQGQTLSATPSLTSPDAFPTSQATTPSRLLRHSREPEHDSEIHARLLLPKKLGWPLWLPSPRSTLPRRYREEGVSIGDVGVITVNGEFDFLFNICRPADDPVNMNQVPSDFKPLSPPLSVDLSHEQNAWKAGAYVLNGSIQEHVLTTAGEDFSLGFDCSACEGAISILPKGGSRQDLLNIADFFNYAGQNAENWYKFVNATRSAGGLGRAASNGALYLITGVDKTTSWGTGSFAGVTGDGAFPIRFRQATSDAAEAEYTFVWCQSGLAATKHGPVQQDFDETRPKENQCIFLRGFRVALSESVWDSLFSPVEVRSIVDTKAESLLSKSRYIPFRSGLSQSVLSRCLALVWGSRSSSNQDTQGNIAASDPEISVSFPSLHPSDTINAGLLEWDEKARVAITHDNTWLSILKDEESRIPDPVDMFKRISSNHIPVSVGGIVSFRPRNTLPGSKKGTTLKILLLGQSDSGKTTAFKRLRMEYTRENWESEKEFWRSIVQLNIVQSILPVVNMLNNQDEGNPSTSQGMASFAASQFGISELPGQEGASSEPAFNAMHSMIAARLANLIDVERDLKMIPTPFVDPAEQELEALVSANEGVTEEHTSSEAQLPVDQGDLATRHPLVRHMTMISAFWDEEGLQPALEKKQVYLHEGPGFFLDDKVRLVNKGPAEDGTLGFGHRDYVPTDYDVLRTWRRTVGIHTCNLDLSSHSDVPVKWQIYDFGGSRTSRATWQPYLDDADTIIFVSSLSAFDQQLEEDPTVNRLDDSLNLWESICGSKILSKTQLILFLNKRDILQRKLDRGVQVAEYVPSYGDQPNEATHVIQHFRKMFQSIHENKSPEPRSLHIHDTTLTDVHTSGETLTSVREQIFQRHLAQSQVV